MGGQAGEVGTEAPVVKAKPRAAGLLQEAREGRRAYYSVDLKRLRELEDWLAAQRRSWQAGLGRLKRLVEHDD